MRPLVKLVIGSLATVLFLAVLSITVSSALAQRGEQPVFHEGQILEITDTSVAIKEWAGTYSYRLRPEGRPALEAAGIRPGDKVSFSAWEANQIAFDFKKQ